MITLFRTTILLASAAALAAQKPTTVEGTVKVADPTNREVKLPVAPVAESITLSKTAPAGVTVPAGLQEATLGTLKLGGKVVAFAVGKGKADAARADSLWVDANADTKWTDDERIALDVTEMPARNGASGERGKPVECTFTLGATKLQAKATYMRVGENEPTLNVSFPAYFEAPVKVGDQERVVAVLDKDLDGTFGSKGDLWALTKAGDNPVSAMALSLIGEKRFLDGQLVSIVVEKNKLVQVASTAAAGPDAKDSAAMRERAEHIWFERFDKERESFVAQRKMDTKRARAKTPVAWNYVPFDEAIALGKKANKPVFIDVMAFWCVWCYRMDYYTYIDQEVADVLNTQFVPCKIIQEQDIAGDYNKMMKEKLQAGGIPAMGIFGPDGSVLVKISGWKAPADSPEGKDEEQRKGFLSKLREGSEAFKAAAPAKGK